MRGDLIELYKIMRGIDRINTYIYPTVFFPQSRGIKDQKT